MDHLVITNSLARPARLAVLRVLDFPRLVFAILFLWTLFAIDLHDPDYYWHLKAGEYILTHGSLPSVDPFSYTFRGEPWVLHEWLFQVVLYAVFDWLGPFGVKVLTASLGTLSVYIGYAAAARLLNGSTAAVMLAIACFPLAALGFSPRPQLVTYVCFAACLYCLIDFKYFQRDRWLRALPVLMVPWVNSHGGYLAGLALLVLFASSEWLMYLVGKRADPVYRNRLLVLSLIGALAVLATLANPYFIDHWIYPFQVMNMDVAIASIAEWQSPNFQQLGFKLYLILALGFLIAWIYRGSGPDLTEIALPVFFIVAGFVSVRHIPLAALALIPFGAVATREGAYASLYARWLNSGRQLGAGEYLLNWAILAGVSIALLAAYPMKQARAVEARDAMIPVKAAEFIRTTGITGRMFNEYRFGGYLIYQFYPRQRVFIDGRADLFGDQFLKEYLDINNGAADWDKLFDKHEIDYVVTPREAPLRQLLLTRGDFRCVYEDDENSVLVKNSPRFAGLIAQHDKHRDETK